MRDRHRLIPKKDRVLRDGHTAHGFKQQTQGKPWMAHTFQGGSYQW